MSDHFDETARRMGKPIEAFGGRGLKKLLVTAAAARAPGFAASTTTCFFGQDHGKPTYGVALMLGAAALVAWRAAARSRARHGLPARHRGAGERARDRVRGDEIAHVMVGRNADPAERAVAVVLIDGKRIEFGSRFWRAEETGHRQEACVRVLRSYVKDVRRG